MRRIIKPVAAKLNMPWMGWHVFRHTHSTLAEQLGMALSDRQAQMGHGDYKMTMHYTHSNLERRRKAVDLMGDRLTGRASEDRQKEETTANVTLDDTKQSAKTPVSY